MLVKNLKPRLQSSYRATTQIVLQLSKFEFICKICSLALFLVVLATKSVASPLSIVNLTGNYLLCYITLLSTKGAFEHEVYLKETNSGPYSIKKLNIDSEIPKVSDFIAITDFRCKDTEVLKYKLPSTVTSGSSIIFADNMFFNIGTPGNPDYLPPAASNQYSTIFIEEFVPGCETKLQIRYGAGHPGTTVGRAGGEAWLHQY